MEELDNDESKDPNYSFPIPAPEDIETKRAEILRSMVANNNEINLDNEAEVNNLIEEAYKQYQHQQTGRGTMLKDGDKNTEFGGKDESMNASDSKAFGLMETI